jgi:hypothetical protein
MTTEQLIKYGKQKFGAGFTDVAQWIADQITTNCDGGEAVDILIDLAEHY